MKRGAGSSAELSVRLANHDLIFLLRHLERVILLIAYPSEDPEGLSTVTGLRTHASVQDWTGKTKSYFTTLNFLEYESFIKTDYYTAFD